nr:odorant binding protein 21 [Pagiophloeus tsushimanus]
MKKTYSTDQLIKICLCIYLSHLRETDIFEINNNCLSINSKEGTCVTYSSSFNDATLKKRISEMKLLVAFALCLTFTAVLADTDEEVKQLVKDAHKKCQEDPATAVDEAELKALRDSKGKGPAPANGGAHALCVSKALGWQKADGSVNKDFLKEKISEDIHDSAKVDEILAEATAEKENEVATAEHLFKLFFKYNREHHHN